MSVYYPGMWWWRIICTITGHDNHYLDLGFPGQPKEAMTLCMRCCHATTEEK